ncbi:MAG: glycoside hydrolase family 97 protein [Fidelibacterota bacterium]|nr:MAG: glycoside hydrolase family 97 protein [Candidatus Neomarinimicrobiota bacterium]
MRLAKLTLLSLVVSLIVLSCESRRIPLTLLSPDGRIEFVFDLDEDRSPVYSVAYDNRLIIAPSHLSLELQEGAISVGMQVVGTSRRKQDETYELVVGKSAQARDYYHEMQVELKEINPPQRSLYLVFRAFNDGIAFRYVLPQQDAIDDFVLIAEHSEFSFPEDHSCWALHLEGFTTNYERPFLDQSLSEIGPQSLVGLPLTIEIGDGPYIAITEADLTDYAAMYLTGVEGSPTTLASILSPLPNDTSISVKGTTPHQSPWRVIMIGDEPGDLIESSIILNLNEPCVISDPSWINPGKAAWPWWSGRTVEGVDFQGGVNTATYKHYLDFAEEFGLEYLLIDAKWYGPHKDPAQDITTTIPEVDLPLIIDYARERNVDILLWLNWENTRDQMDVAFPLYESWGVKGVKVDYMNRDDQEMVRFYHAVVKKAAAHHLVLDFHGSYKPTGIRRTYPNLLTREGILGLEHTKWSDRITPEHNVTIPFTRMLAGPMDYTPGAFQHVTREEFVPRYDAPTAMGTRCHHLAMFVVYESTLQMVSDYPGAYRGEPGADFLSQVPASWDETRVLSGVIGDYVVIARRQNQEWFIGAMTDWDSRSLELRMDFLGDGQYRARIYSDGPGADEDPASISIRDTTISASEMTTIEMASGGGYVMYLTPTI